MKSVKLDRNELLRIVSENAVKHQKEYTEAVEDYKAAMLKIAQDNLKIVKTGELEKLSKVKLYPSAPSSYIITYRRAIRMLELSIEEVVELEEDVFNQLVLDEWHWKHQFSVASAMYKSMV